MNTKDRDRSKEAGNVKVSVVDRRHHASGETEAQQGDRSPYPSVVQEMEERMKGAEALAREAIARAEAEIDAVRQRLSRDVERRVNEGRARLLGAVLEVVDNLERAAATARAESATIADGVELILRQVLGIVSAEGVEPIETLGHEFDPKLAEAIGVEPVEPERHNVVVTEVRRGYRLGDAILRPARVIIGRAESP